MRAAREQRLDELVTRIATLADNLPMRDAEPEDLTTLVALQRATTELWTIWREVTVQNDLAT